MGVACSVSAQRCAAPNKPMHPTADTHLVIYLNGARRRMIGSIRRLRTCGETPMSWKDEDAQIIREMIKQESDVSNHRLTWMVTLQGLLFAGLGFAWKEGKALITVLAILGVLSSASSLIALHIAHRATVKML